MSNEHLCLRAQKGDDAARDLLLESNLGFIRKTANELYQNMALAETELAIDRDDLEQEGCIGLLNAIESFDANRERRFLTYAAPSIRNAMMNLIRAGFSQFEQQVADDKNGLGFRFVRLGKSFDIPFAPSGNGEKFSAPLRIFPRRLHTDRRNFAHASSSICVSFPAKSARPAVTEKRLCSHRHSPFPASAGAKGITH